MSRGHGTDHSGIDLRVTLAPGTGALALGGPLLDAQALLAPVRDCLDRIREPSQR